MRISKCRLSKVVRARTTVAGGAVVLTAGLLALAHVQMADALPAPSLKQTLMHVTTVGFTTIHGGAEASGAVSQPEVQPGDDSTIGVKNQVAGRAPPAAATSAAASAATSFLNRHHGAMPIPGKSESAHGISASGLERSESSTSQSAALPPPPTAIPNPKGSRVIDSSGKVFGFNGLTHRDQRLAGTGIYKNTQFSLEPPDQGLCAGGGFVVEAVNNAIAVYDRSGNRLAGPEAMSQFWGLAPEVIRSTPPVYGPFISDPKCVYDHETERWFVTELMQDNGSVGSGRNFNLIAVSKTSDPRGGFAVFEYDVTDDGNAGTPKHANCPCFGDQPLLGLDAYGIYQSTNEYNNAGTLFNGAQVYALPKKGLVEAANGDYSHLYVVTIDAAGALVPYGGLSYTIQPAVASGGEESEDRAAVASSVAASDEESSGRGVEYFLSALQFGSPPYQLLDNRIAVWALSNTRSLLTKSPDLSLAFDVIASETYGQPNPAKQKPGPTPYGSSLKPPAPLELINTNDDRMNQVVYANGLLYSGVNTIIGDGSRTGIAWFGVKPHFKNGAVSGKVERQGYVAVNGQNVIFPSIAFGGEENGAMVFTLVGPDYFPSAAFVKMGEEEGTSAVHIAADGAAPDDGFTGYPPYGHVGRWGDYSAAVSDGGTVWMATEYIPNLPRTLIANWGTYIIGLK